MRESPLRLFSRLSLLGLVGSAALALASLPTVATAESAEHSALDAWKPSTCTRWLCRRPPASPVSAVAGFGMAAAAAALLARRTPQQPADRERRPGKQ
jgi:hypothetical protein